MLPNFDITNRKAIVFHVVKSGQPTHMEIWHKHSFVRKFPLTLSSDVYPSCDVHFPERMVNLTHERA